MPITLTFEDKAGKKSTLVVKAQVRMWPRPPKLHPADRSQSSYGLALRDWVQSKHGLRTLGRVVPGRVRIAFDTWKQAG